MDYQELTGVASPEALIDAICSFAVSNGWTEERNALVGGNRTATIRLTGVTDYVHLFNTNTTEMNMRVSVGYDGGVAPSANPNVQAFDSRTNGLIGPYPRVYFFCNDDADAIHVVVSTATSEEYRNIAIGRLEKIGAYDGGTYADGTYRSTNWLGDMWGAFHHAPFYGGSGNSSVGPTSNMEPFRGAVRADVASDSRVNFFHWFGDDAPNATYGRARTGISTWAHSAPGAWLGVLAGGADMNIFSGRTILHPIHVYVDRTGAPTYRSPIGTVKNTRFCNLAKLAPAQEITIGSEVWKVFPLVKKSMTSAVAHDAPNLGSHTAGYAIRKS